MGSVNTAVQHFTRWVISWLWNRNNHSRQWLKIDWWQLCTSVKCSASGRLLLNLSKHSSRRDWWLLSGTGRRSHWRYTALPLAHRFVVLFHRHRSSSQHLVHVVHRNWRYCIAQTNIRGCSTVTCRGDISWYLTIICSSRSHYKLKMSFLIINMMQSEMVDFAPVPPPGELDETYASSLISAHSLHHMETWRHPQNRKYIKSCLPSAEDCAMDTGIFARVLFDMQVDRQTTNKQTNIQTRWSHFYRGRSKEWLT